MPTIKTIMTIIRLDHNLVNHAVIIISEFLTCWHVFAYMLCIHE